VSVSYQGTHEPVKLGDQKTKNKKQNKKKKKKPLTPDGVEK
jgi:hypothetical protein